MVVLQANETWRSECLGIPGVCKVFHKIVATYFSTERVVGTISFAPRANSITFLTNPSSLANKFL